MNPDYQPSWHMTTFMGLTRRRKQFPSDSSSLRRSATDLTGSSMSKIVNKNKLENYYNTWPTMLTEVSPLKLSNEYRDVKCRTFFLYHASNSTKFLLSLSSLLYNITTFFEPIFSAIVTTIASGGISNTFSRWQLVSSECPKNFWSSQMSSDCIFLYTIHMYNRRTKIEF